MSRLRRWPSSLRARVVLGAVAATTLTLLLVGALLLAAIARDGRRAVDRELKTRASSVGSSPAVLFGEGGGGRGFPFRPGGLRQPDTEALLSDTGTFVQIAVGTHVLARRGGVPHDPPAVPADTGLRTVSIGGDPWRSLTVSVRGPLRLQLLQSLDPVDARVASVRRIAIALGLLALLLVALAAYLLTGLAMRPLAALRDSAGRVSSTGDLHTPLPAEGPDEVRDLGATLNAMLARIAGSTAALERALAGTRRFAADAGHELRTPLTGLRANVDVLRRNPDLPEGERDAILAEITAEQERMVHLLDGLTALARGEAAEAIPREPVAVGDLVDAAVDGARRRHPGVDWTLSEDVGEATLDGWDGGLRLMLDNLLGNAALHGRPDGHVRVTLAADGDALRLRVEDDGPGLPVEEREHVLEPFRRGRAARADGTGLGLAIAAQQAALHGGALTLGASELGGLGAEVRLPRAAPLAAA